MFGSYIFGKAFTLKFGSKESGTKQVEVIHTDVCKPFERSFLVILIRFFSNYRYTVFPLSKKNQKYKIIFCKLSKNVNMLDIKFKAFFTDNEGEFDNIKMKNSQGKLLFKKFCREGK